MPSIFSFLNKPSLSKNWIYSFRSSKDLKKSDEFLYYSKIRIYKDRNILQLMNQLMIANLCKSNFFVRNSLTFVTALQKVLGKNIAKLLIKNTMGRVFTGGEDLLYMNKFSVKLMKDNDIPVIYFYSHEVIPGYEFTTKEYEQNKQEFIKSMEASKITNENNMVALKMSAIGSFNSIKSLNVCEYNLIDLFKKIDNEKNGKITLMKLRDYIFRNLNQIKMEDFSFFVKNILGKEIDYEGEISLDEWKIKVHALYIDDVQKTLNPIIQNFSILSMQDISNLNEMNKRLIEIFELGLTIKARILVDAEQTFAQKAVDTLTEQFQMRFNKKQTMIYNTMQNYLKSMKDRIVYEVNKCKTLSLPLALKMVRGAYMDEERLLAKKNNIESPICDSFELTTESYHNNINYLISNLTKNSEILVGSHNKDSILFVKKLLEKHKIDKFNGEVKFGQLLGLADHLTYSLKDEGYHVLKLIPYGKTEILIPYLLRRAQESRVNLSSTILQKALLVDEIKQKFNNK